MGKKIKSKQRLDKFYHFAKEQGYRSRAAFKLIQLNRKYSFLNNANILIDLCAAPGGWLQVADQFMPMTSLKLGFDLDPIKPIPNVKTYVEDITKPACLNIIKRELQSQKADVVLHDGAPNVGANWSKDAYGQNELVLQSLKLATQVLRAGGTFVTKVFRSNDYNSLIWVLNKFFEKVEATKPEASRLTSAEIFVVGLRYLAPNYIDPNLFDAKCVFKDTEADNLFENQYNEINSLGKLLEKRRWRGGYDDKAPQNLFKRISLEKFVKAENPFAVFVEFNEIEISEEEREKYGKLAKFPEDFEENVKDIKVLGKREIAGLLKWRSKVNVALKKLRIQEKVESLKETQQENSEEELENAIEKASHAEIQKNRKIKEKKEKQYMKYAKNYGETVNDEIFAEEDEELFDIFKHKSLKKLEYMDVEENEEDIPENPLKKPKIQEISSEKSAKLLENSIEKLYEAKLQRKNQKKLEKVPKTAKKLTKTAKTVKPAKISKAEPLTFSNPKNPENLEENSSNPQADFKENSAQLSKILKKKWFDKPLFGDLLSSAPQSFSNPLKNQEDFEETPAPSKPPVRKKRGASLTDSEEESKKYEIKVPLSEMEKRRRRLKRQRQKDAKKQGNENSFEIVDNSLGNSHHALEDYDLESASETLALAKKMLRKKDREAIIESTFNRFAFEDTETAPKWFREDELAHNHVILPISKEEFRAEREKLLAINSKTPKKIAEAKIRNYKRAAKKMKRTKQKAEAIFEQEGVTEGIKARQIRKLYKKEALGLKKKKKYIVATKNNAGPGKTSRYSKFVDRRLKKDKRNDVAKAKAKDGFRKKIRKGNKKFNRRKRK